VAVHGDITEGETVARLRDVALEGGGGRVDVLVNNVGDYRPGHGLFVRTDEDGWRAQYAITLEHVFRCMHAFVPIMQAQGRARSSTMRRRGDAGDPYNSVYSAFNAGVIAFTKSMAVELGRDGIRVNCIAPDMADTLQTPADAMLPWPRPRAHQELDPARPIRDCRGLRQGGAVPGQRHVEYVTATASRSTAAPSPRAAGTAVNKKKGFTNLPDNP
jgi:NAD(P)-dependent dehydrogenase (short-subunit alcohol dehydrogenase family)